MEHWDWEDVCGVLVVVFVLATAVFLAVTAVKEKRVDGYYLGRVNQNTPSVTCVWAHWTWHTDEMVYCSDDRERALDFLNRANASLGTK